MKICFVLLHYFSLEDTERCVESIMKLENGHNISIVIVDNNSPNDSGRVLLKEYEQMKNIKVLLLKDNIGFAKGNNIGFEYAKNKMEADFIFVMNNDTVIKDRNFVTKVIEKYYEYSFDILGPDIITPEGLHQNPLRLSSLSKLKVYKRLVNKGILLCYYELKRVFHLEEKIRLLERISEYQDRKNKNNIAYRKFRENVVLQGACIIYSPKFIKNEKYAFIPDTFMYGEEDLLAAYACAKHYKVVYDPTLSIIHMDGSSTKKKCENAYDKNYFFVKNTFASTKILLKKMKIWSKSYE